MWRNAEGGSRRLTLFAFFLHVRFVAMCSRSDQRHRDGLRRHIRKLKHIRNPSVPSFQIM
jgi:hypothetical protein